MEQVVKKISPSDLLKDVREIKNNGYRLVAISCTNNDGMEISYSFDKNYDFFSLRLNIQDDVEIDSISQIYPFAFLYENEIKELFGVKIKDIAIDFEGNLYKTSIDTPFNVKAKENSDGE